MKIKKGQEKVYHDWLNKQKDSYGQACFQYSNYWAEILELKITNNETVTKEIIEKSSFEADEKPGMGITGFMFGVAKSILINCWEHGHLIEYHYTNDMERKKFLERQLKLERILK